MAATRQERRSRDRALTRRHGPVLRRGLGEAGDPPDAVILTHHLIGLLTRRSDQRRASNSKAAAAVHKAFEATLDHHRAVPALDCRKGCALCCSLFVSAAIPEVLLLAQAVQRGAPEDAAALRAAIAASRDAAAELVIGDQVRKPVPCGLLADDVCRHYGARPLGCRGHVSQSLEACQANAEDPAAPIPGSRPHGVAAQDCKLALFAALKALGLPHRSYELNAALARALETEDAEKRWLAGEDIFDGLPVDPTRSQGTEDLLDRMIRDATP
jgi:Fe-S-cluster containining protein